MEELEAQDIAIIGLAGRYPKCNSLEHFWQNLNNGNELTTEFSDEELITSGIDKALLDDKNYKRVKGFLEDADKFDAEFFNYCKKEAKLIDPQQRIFLELCYEALLSAGYKTKYIDENIGVFAASSFNTYLLKNLYGKAEFNDENSYYQTVIANSNDFLASRVSYKLNLKGPAQTIQTGCSSSLVALHYARQSLLNYDCDIALAGGISITSPLKSGYLYRQDSIGSIDGHCRPFDIDASGTVPGNGGGIVVLKRLDDALKHGDCILAILKGSAINNDGSNKQSYTAPSPNGQAKVIKTAHIISSCPPETISYIETHGTGTKLGDPIEFEGLKQAFQGHNTKRQCALGSVKANLGHLDAASGIAGFIKVVMMLCKKTIPPQINFTKMNERIDIDSSPFYINKTPEKWQSLSPLRAGISSFGIGGTNAHAILQEGGVNVENFNFSISYKDILKHRSYWINPENRHVINKDKAPVYGSDLKEIVTNIVKDLLETEEVIETDKFADLGMDSLMNLDFVIRLKEDLSLSVSVEELTKYDSISALIEYLSTNSAQKINLQVENYGIPRFISAQSSHGRSIIHFKKGSKYSPKLFLIHPAGGAVSIFKDIAGRIKSNMEIIGIQSHGWGEDESPDQTIEAMAARYLDVIQSTESHGPYYLCGSSVGGLIAHELSYSLTKLGKEIGLLAMLDTPFPTEEMKDLFLPSNEIEIETYIDYMSREYSQSLSKLNSDYKQKFFKLWQIQSRSILNYKIKPNINKIVFFSAQEKIATSNFARDWLEKSEAALEIYKINGNHLTIHSGENAEYIANLIEAKIRASYESNLEKLYQLAA